MFPRGKRSLWFSARNNKFSPDAGLSTTHNWRHRGWWWSGEPRHPLPPPLASVPLYRHRPTTPVPPLFGSISSHSLYAVIARPGGDIGVRMDRHKGMRLFTLRLPLSQFSRLCALAIHHPLSPSSLSLSLSHSLTLSLPPFLFLSLSLSLAHSHIRCVYASVLLLVEPFYWPHTVLASSLPVYYSVRSFLLHDGDERNALWTRVTRETS